MVLAIIIIFAIYSLLAGVLSYFVGDPLEDPKDALLAFLTPVLFVIVGALFGPIWLGNWISKKLDEKFDLKK